MQARAVRVNAGEIRPGDQVARARTHSFARVASIREGASAVRLLDAAGRTIARPRKVARWWKLEARPPLEDQVCACGHWYGEHSDDDEAGPAHCEGCHQSGAPDEHPFSYSAEQSSPEAIADRGGDPEKWPAHVKEAIKP